jgi:hypothetical protein
MYLHILVTIVISLIIRQSLPNGIEKRFRMEVGKRMGEKRGNFIEVLIEAIDEWIEKSELEIKEKKR